MKSLFFSTCQIILTVVIALDLTAGRAHAYIDPGAGSYALQVALAGLAGVLVSAKLIFAKLRALLHRGSASKAAVAEDDKGVTPK